jgi:hypothetical protein
LRNRIYWNNEIDSRKGNNPTGNFMLALTHTPTDRETCICVHVDVCVVVGCVCVRACLYAYCEERWKWCKDRRS